MSINSTNSAFLLAERTAFRIRFACKLLVIVGALVQLGTYPGPTGLAMAGWALIGVGLAAHTFTDLYQRQPQLSAREFVPYCVGMVSFVVFVAVGMATGYVDVRVGMAFYAVLAGVVILFARLFTYDASVGK